MDCTVKMPRRFCLQDPKGSYEPMQDASNDEQTLRG